jgi:hypothetical protein
MEGHTDFTGPVDMNCVWKLNGLSAAGAAAPEAGASSRGPSSSAIVKEKVGVGGREEE